MVCIPGRFNLVSWPVDMSILVIYVLSLEDAGVGGVGQ